MLSQYLLNWALRCPAERRKTAALVWHARAALTRLLGPRDQVRYRLYDYDLRLPALSDLPSKRTRFPQYGNNLGRIARAVAGRHDGGCAIDIGANCGDTALTISHYSHMPVLCIEASRAYCQLCRINTAQISRIQVVNAFVDANTNTIAGTLTEEKGSGHIVAKDDASEQAVSLVDILRQHPEFESAKLLKIDTDGFDGRIIAGAGDWLGAAAPVLFWECDPICDSQCAGPGINVFRILADCGYGYFLFYTNQGDYLASSRASDSELPVDLFLYFSNRRGHPPHYMDVCAVPERDEALFTIIRQAELRRLRSQ